MKTSFLNHELHLMTNGKIALVNKDGANIGQFDTESDAKFWALSTQITLAQVQTVKNIHRKLCSEYPGINDQPRVPVIVATELQPGQFLMDGPEIHLGVQFWPKNIVQAPTNRPLRNDDGSFTWLVLPLW